MLLLLVALVSSASPVLLQDIAPGAAIDSERYLEVDTGADPNLLVVDNDFWGAELFTILDGRRSLVIDLCPGPCSGNPSELTRFGARLFFLGSDAGDAVPDQLWITDGTAAGTVKLAADVTRILLLGEQLVFQKGADLWVSDGSPAGTAALTWGKSRALASAQLTPLHRFLTVNPAACELFVTGIDVRQATALALPSGVERCDEPLATLAERAFLALPSGLWRFEATPAPAVMIDAPVLSPIRVGSGLFFFRSAPLALSLFHSSGEPGGATPLGTVISDQLERWAALGPRLLYTARHPSGAGHLYSSDGTPTGTIELPMTATATYAILPVGPVAYVVSALGATDTELLETDGTASGTVVLQGVRPAHAILQAGHREARGHAMALAMIGEVVNETGAFRIRPGENPEAIFLKPGNPRGSALSEPVVMGMAAFFNASNHAFRTDGTAAGTAPFLDAGSFVGAVGGKVLISDGDALAAVPLDGGAAEALGAGPFSDPVSVDLGGTAVFAAGNGPRKLWRTDGTAAGTTALADLGTGVSFTAVALPNARAVFSLGEAIWFTDGTAAGTRSVLVPGYKGTAPLPANDAVWVVSGLASVSRVTAQAAVTVPVPVSVRGPDALAASGDDLFFLTHGPASAEVWRASGSTATKLATLKSARALAIYKSRLMVLGDTGDGPKLLELVGTALVARCPAPGSTFLRVAAGTLFVDAATPDQGLELHVFQEYAQSPTSLLLSVGDLSPGPGSSTPSPPIAFGKKFLFSTWTPEAGREPWAWEPDPPPPDPKRGCGCGADPGGLTLLALALWGLRRARRLLDRLAMRSALTAVVCAGVLLLAADAHADNTADEADVAFSLGNQAYGKREYDKALSWYFLSNRLVPNRNVLFNIARCFEALSRFDEAFRYFFELSSQTLAEDDTREVKAALARLAPKVALLSVSSQPSDADVYVDREDLGSRGRSPLTLALPPGPHTVILKRSGFLNAEGKATISKGRDSKLKLSLERILGTIEVTGTPEGATVRETTDGPVLATLPAKLSFVPGQKLLVVTAEGYAPQQLLVDVRPDALASLTARLVPLPRPTGKVIVTANRESALVRVDGKESGFTPTVLSLPEGEYVIEVSAKDLTASRTKVKVGKDTEERVAAELRYLPPAVRAASKSLLSVDEAPASVTVITREELQSFGYQTLAEAVQAVRGVFISNDRVYTYIGIRGFSPAGDLNTRIAILWDGHVMNDVWAGQGFSARDLDVDLNEIDRIEIVRGPGSALYGTGALFAVINCVPRDTLGDRNVEGTVAAGGQGGVSARATGSVQGSAGSVLLSAAGFTAKGAETTNFPAGGVVNGIDGERSIGTSMRAKSGGFTLTAKWNQRRKEIPNSALGATFGIPGTKYVDARGFAELRYEKDFGRASFGARVSYDASRFHGVYAVAENDEAIRYDQDIGGGDWLGLELRTRIRLFGENFLTAGFEAQGSQIFQNSYNNVASPPIDTRQRLLLSGYVLDEWRIHPRLFVQGGVRVDKYLDLSALPVSPRLGVVGKPYARGLTKLVVGQAFRAPNIYELFFQDNRRSLLPAGPLKPETIVTLEAEHSHDLTPELRLTASGFYNLINQLIVTQSEPGAASCGSSSRPISCGRYGNSDKQISALGAEGQVRWQPGRYTLVEGTYSFVNLHDPNADVDGMPPTPDVQLHLASLRALVPLYEGAVRLSAQLTYQSPRKVGTQGSLLINFGISGEYGVLRYFAGVQNLLDSTAALPVGSEAGDSLVPQYGRSFLIQVSAGF